MVDKVNPIADAPLPTGSIFAGRYRIEDDITHGERKWTYRSFGHKGKRA
jgi:hypothetical protein